MPTTERTTCRMQGCDHRPDGDGFCTNHLVRFINEPQWCPIRVMQRPDAEEPGVTMSVCGLCGAEVWFLERKDRVFMHYALDREPADDGRCEIIGGGFRVVNERAAVHARTLGVPLYRAHGPACPKRPKPMDALL